MNDIAVDCKEIEYAGRFQMALLLGKREKARKLALAALVIYRLQSRKAHAKAEGKRAEIRSLRRPLKKMEASNLKFPLGELRMKKLEGELAAAEKELACVGEQIHNMLELWQSVGAAFEDLCNLCNRDPAQVGEEIGEEQTQESFSKLVMVYNLDYKNPRDTGWLEDSVDAPLTHALKAYLLDTMLHTEAGRKASREAMEAVFPEVMNHVVYPVTDEDGVQHLYDKDGNEIGTLAPEE